MVHHSDRGSVYASEDYSDGLTKIGAVQSMSRKGDCWDNAVAESFFATIKGQMIDHEDYPTRRAAIEAIADYIDGFYNPCRRHSALGYVSPIEYELRKPSPKPVLTIEQTLLCFFAPRLLQAGKRDRHVGSIGVGDS